MDPRVYQIIHVSAALLLTALTFQAFAAPDPEKRKGLMIKSGILSFLMLVGGFGLLAKLEIAWELWVIVKLVCWVLLSMMAGLAFRAKGATGVLSLVTAVIVITAVCMVYLRPML